MGYGSMRNGALNLVLSASLISSIFGTLFVYFNPAAAAAFAYLVSKVLVNAARSLEFSALAQSNPQTDLAPIVVNPEMIFYAILSLCAILLTFSACSSILSMMRRERFARRLEMSHDQSRAEPSASFDLNRSKRFSPWGFARGLLERRPVDRDSWAPRSYHGNSFLAKALWRLAAINYGLVGKMVVIFAGAIAVFGIVTVFLVHAMLLPSLKRQAIERAKITVLNLPAVAPVPLAKKNGDAVNELLRKKVSAAGLAYILVEDGTGDVVAHSFDNLPKQPWSRGLAEGLSQETQTTIKFGDALVYEARFPIGEARIHSARVGVWKNDIDAELGRVVAPIMKLVVVVVIAEIVFAVLLIWRLTRPLLRLVRSARRISIGELDTVSPGVEDRGEFGELSRALERMRSSVKAAMARL